MRQGVTVGLVASALVILEAGTVSAGPQATPEPQSAPENDLSPGVCLPVSQSRVTPSGM